MSGHFKTLNGVELYVLCAQGRLHIVMLVDKFSYDVVHSYSVKKSNDIIIV